MALSNQYLHNNYMKIQKNALTRQHKKFSFEQQHSCNCNYEATAHQFHNEKKHDLLWR